MASRRKYQRKSKERPTPNQSSGSNFYRNMIILAVVLLLALGGYRYYKKLNPPPPEGITFVKEGELRIQGEDGTEIAKLDIEVAGNPQEIQQGLMYRQSMEENQGMLFLMPENRLQSFWMRNTFIPLDIIFIDTEKKIVSIQKNAKPHDETSLPSAGPAQYVLEVNAGYSDKHGLKKGTQLNWTLQ